MAAMKYILGFQCHHLPSPNQQKQPDLSFIKQSPHVFEQYAVLASQVLRYSSSQAFAFAFAPAPNPFLSTCEQYKQVTRFALTLFSLSQQRSQETKQIQKLLISVVGGGKNSVTEATVPCNTSHTIEFCGEVASCCRQS